MVFAEDDRATYFPPDDFSGLSRTQEQDLVLYRADGNLERVQTDVHISPSRGLLTRPFRS